MQLIPIKYHNLEYPDFIKCKIKEVAGHFDTVSIQENGMKISLHTEYSAVHRKLNSSIIQKYQAIVNSQSASRTSKPKLWINEQWAKEFADFIIEILNGIDPEIIEIHPPNNRQLGVHEFFSLYEMFLQKIRSASITSKIMIENRNGFMLSSVEDFNQWSKYIGENQIDLSLIVDFPQLINFEKARNDADKLKQVLQRIEAFQHNVSAFHIWGQVGKRAHMGDMNDYFNGDNQLVEIFYNNLGYVFRNHESPIYFIPEINFGITNKKTRQVCLKNIIEQLLTTGFVFA